MAVFASFSRLPTELQHMIWKLALEDESKNRFILFDPSSKQFTPTRSLASPLLSVNSQSRHLALKYFDTAIEVFRMPPIGRLSLPPEDEHELYAEEMKMADDYRWSWDPDRYCNPKGLLRVNLARDIIFPIQVPSYLLRMTQEWHDLAKRDKTGSLQIPLNHSTKPFLEFNKWSGFRTLHLFSLCDPRPQGDKYLTTRWDCYPVQLFMSVESVSFLVLQGKATRESLLYDLSTLSGGQFLEKWGDDRYYMQCEFCEPERLAPGRPTLHADGCSLRREPVYLED